MRRRAKPHSSTRNRTSARIEKIDAHVHLHGRADQFMAQAISDHFRVLTINVDYPDFPPIDAQLAAALSLRQRYPGRVAFAATFSVEDFSSPTWAAQQVTRIEAAFQHGAVGVKLWKNIGMDLKDGDRYVMPDDPRFEPILCGHRACAPRAAWPPGGAVELLAAIQSNDGEIRSRVLQRASAVLHA